LKYLLDFWAERSGEGSLTCVLKMDTVFILSGMFNIIHLFLQQQFYSYGFPTALFRLTSGKSSVGIAHF